MIEIINKYIITWLYKTFCETFTKNLTYVKSISKLSTPIITTGPTDRHELPRLKVSVIKTFLNRPNNAILNHDCYMDFCYF